jgi:NADPH:quinone reductase-like Zn-dependent oxidoreductase
MKAVFCTKYGNPEVLQLQDVEKSVPKENEILVRIFSTCVNSGDVRVRGLAVRGFLKIIMRFVLGFSKPRKPILGTVFSGVVERIGNSVTQFKVGDSVFGMTGFKFGTHAEYMTISQNGNVVAMPNGATHDEAASLIFGGQTAIHFFDKMKIAEKPNATILIIGATGSVGTSAVQLASYYGARVTAVCSSNGRSLIERLGIADIILYDKENYVKRADQFDFIFDAVGKTTKKQCAHLLKKGGVYKSVGGLEAASESKEQLELLKALFEKGLLKAVIDRKYPLEEIVAAHTYVDTGRKKGNVVIKIVE